ncbi:hypothetical protein SAMD00019534_062080 [Acytostelium subglobosum LB1]|uniref:hypothetical protein n=1 Tax=Acytostelium subglobosum LB1 TaxID=1410327 RepID=UPI000644DFD1|nr:hypothetical protein SAMD00019534_062080 [Acytostelium subglobosum LB1]GAM23033.1 hypothetical protein SAMD00019534_062080 [Acytostelium subglobosum LB1]|eukprot:XP_012754260.1 hypothetical protein SAMD00019534_062080 [Acytostelium subglobosum LB1]
MMKIDDIKSVHLDSGMVIDVDANNKIVELELGSASTTIQPDCDVVMDQEKPFHSLYSYYLDNRQAALRIDRASRTVSEFPVATYTK